MQEKEPNKVAEFLSKNNLLIFVVIIATGLTVAVLDLSYILFMPYSITSNGQTDNPINIDEAAISEIEKYNISDENMSGKDLPEGRINPFSEN